MIYNHSGNIQSFIFNNFTNRFKESIVQSTENFNIFKVFPDWIFLMKDILPSKNNLMLMFSQLSTCLKSIYHFSVKHANSLLLQIFSIIFINFNQTFIVIRRT